MDYKFTVYLACLICDEVFEDEVTGIPEGWGNHFMSLSDEDSFCPKHSDMTKFLNNQCPGCVGTFPDCPLHSAIFYRKPNITNEELEIIEQGICPRRVNGTYMFNAEAGGLKKININDISNDGLIFANGIREYLKQCQQEYYDSEISKK